MLKSKFLLRLYSFCVLVAVGIDVIDVVLLNGFVHVGFCKRLTRNFLKAFMCLL